MSDGLGSFLARGFRARERAGLHTVWPTGDAPGGARVRERACDVDCADFGLALDRAKVTPDEEAALWGRYVLEGSVGVSSSQATAEDVALFLSWVACEWRGNNPRQIPRSTVESIWSCLRAADMLGCRLTTRAVKLLIRHGETKLAKGR